MYLNIIMSFNKILLFSLKNKLSFYFQNHNIVYHFSFPYLKKNYLCSQITKNDNSKKKNEISEKSFEKNHRKIDCGEIQDENIEMEDMFCETSVGKEWGGPMRGGQFYEPTRYGDWERKGRCTDF